MTDGQLRSNLTNLVAFGNFLSIDYVEFEGIGAITNFTGVVKRVAVNAPSNAFVVVQKTMSAEQAEVVIIETNLAAQNLESLTNLVVGKTYVFPECVIAKTTPVQP